MFAAVPFLMFQKFTTDAKLRARLVDRFKKMPQYRFVDPDELDNVLKNCDKLSFAEFRRDGLTMA